MTCVGGNPPAHAIHLSYMSPTCALRAERSSHAFVELVSSGGGGCWVVMAVA